MHWSIILFREGHEFHQIDELHQLSEPHYLRVSFANEYRSLLNTSAFSIFTR